MRVQGKPRPLFGKPPNGAREPRVIEEAHRVQTYTWQTVSTGIFTSTEVTDVVPLVGFEIVASNLEDGLFSGVITTVMGASSRSPCRTARHDG